MSRFKSCWRAPFIALALVAAMCATALASSPGTGPKAHAALDQVNVAAFPVSTQLMLPYIASDRAYFKKAGLSVKVTTFTAGNVVSELPLVLNGTINIGVGNVSDYLPLIAGGAPIVIIPGGGTVTDAAKVSSNVIVSKNPAIKSPKDLVGKTVALNSVGGLTQIYTALQVKKDGGDPTKVNFVRLSVASIPAALDSGQIDAGQSQEPIMWPAIKKYGLHVVDSIGDGVAVGLPQVAYFTSKTWAASHAAEIKLFQKAIEQSARAAKNRSYMRYIVSEYSTFAKGSATVIKNFGTFTDQLTPKLIQRVARLLQLNGAVGRLPTYKSYIFGA